MNMKLCINCKWYNNHFTHITEEMKGEVQECMHPGVPLYRSPVDGVQYHSSCETLRQKKQICGPKGKLFNFNSRRQYNAD